MLRTITRPSRGGAAVLATGLVCLAPAPAQAAGGPGAILQDCAADGHIDGSYPPAAYAKALSQLPTDLDEYSDCRSQIRSAQLRAAGAAMSRDARSTSRPGSAGTGGRPSSGGSGPQAPSGGGVAATARSASAHSAAPGAPAPPAPAAPIRAAPSAPVSATVHEAAVSPTQVAGGLTLLALAVGLTGALGPRFLRRRR